MTNPLVTTTQLQQMIQGRDTYLLEIMQMLAGKDAQSNLQTRLTQLDDSISSPSGTIQSMS